MIGMMYLVLTALLALNVSREVLDAFVLVDEGLVKTTNNFFLKNDMIYQEFDRAAAEAPVKAGPWKAKADEVRRRSNELTGYIQELKLEIVTTSEGKDTEAIEEDEIHGMKIQAKDNTDIPAEIMVGDNYDGKANDLRAAIEEYREYLLSLIPESNQTIHESIQTSLDTSDPPPVEGVTETWQSEHFEHLPLIAVITLMSKMQGDVRNAESEAIRYLYGQIEAGTFKFNKLEPVIITNSNFIVRGNEYRANIFMAAFDTTQTPEIFIGDYDSTVLEDGTVEYQIRGDLGTDYQQVPVEGGTGVYRVNTTRTGIFSYSGIIRLKRLDGSYTKKPFRASYEVSPPSFVVSPTKMNVFYLGVDNPVEISVPGFLPDQIVASTTNGRISGSGNNYVVRPTKEGASQINVAVRVEGKTRAMGSKPFRVRTVPDPYPTLAGRTGGSITRSDLLAQTGVEASMPDWFEFDLEFEVTSFTVSATIRGFLREEVSSSGRFTPEQREILRTLNVGSRLYIIEIKAVGPDGSVRNLPSISLKIR